MGGSGSTRSAVSLVVACSGKATHGDAAAGGSDASAAGKASTNATAGAPSAAGAGAPDAGGTVNAGFATFIQSLEAP